MVAVATTEPALSRTSPLFLIEDQLLNSRDIRDSGNWQNQLSKLKILSTKGVFENGWKKRIGQDENSDTDTDSVWTGPKNLKWELSIDLINMSDLAVKTFLLTSFGMITCARCRFQILIEGWILLSKKVFRMTSFQRCLHYPSSDFLSVHSTVHQF